MKRLMINLFVLPLCFLLGWLFNCFVLNGFELNYDALLLLHPNTFVYAFEFSMIYACYALFKIYKKYLKKTDNTLLESKENDKHILAGLEQAHFQTDKELNDNYLKVKFSDLKNKVINGVPIKAEFDKGKLEVVFTKPAHSLIIGTTGSGKTTSFINPTVQILSELKNKPSILISDPKGELYSLHSKTLKDKGYSVKVLDLRNPYKSVRWNPLERPYLKHKRALSLESEVVEDEEHGTYSFENEKYYDKKLLDNAVKVKKQELNDEVYEDLHDIVSVLCPVKNKGEPIWESGAKNFILAIVLAMLEDSENEKLGMTKEKFNFYNLMKIATNTENECEELKRYFAGRSPISKSVSLSKQVLDASEKTRGSYLSTVFDKLSIFSDLSICSLTSINEIDFSVISNTPTAFFLQIPDEKETRHTLASMVILQAYKELVAEANKYEDLSLPRSVHFLLDEFGNLPQIHKLEQIITVGRSRKIWLSLVVQSYSQLAKVYDDKSADIIKSNCNIQYFIGTTDLKTIQEFSRLCGNFSIISRNVSFGKKDTSTSASVKERPLIYPTELQQLNSPGNMGNMIINVFGYSPIKSKFTPSYLCPIYKFEKVSHESKPGSIFDEENIFYNMQTRNGKVVGTNNSLVKKLSADEVKIIVDNLNHDLIPEKEKVKIKSLIDKREYQKAYKIIDGLLETLDEKEVELSIIEKIKEVKKLLGDFIYKKIKVRVQ